MSVTASAGATGAGVWCASVVGEGGVENGVRFEAGADGRITARTVAADPAPGDLHLGTVVAGAGNAHSHAFHRALRGRTHDQGGDFWRWRDSMYAVASVLDPDSYFAFARAVFAEMLVAGYTAVGEFHYLHHRPDGSPYPHEFELALVAAAGEVGIRLTLLDTAYLESAPGQALKPEQRRFGDRDAAAYLARWHELQQLVPALGAAIHSVRAVPPAALAEIVAGLPPHVPLHVHLSEQPRENSEVRAAYGVSPTRLLHELGVLSARTSVVHATHLEADDIALIGAAGAGVVMCPTTEADLGDGIGPARALRDAGAVLALGSDQNAVIDPFLEVRGLEMHERLASGRRGVFSPSELLAASGSGSYRALGLGAAGPVPFGGPTAALRSGEALAPTSPWHEPARSWAGGAFDAGSARRETTLQVGDLLDLVEVAVDTERTLGAQPAQLSLVATSADVRRVVVSGSVVADTGILVSGSHPADLLRDALTFLTRTPRSPVPPPSPEAAHPTPAAGAAAADAPAADAPALATDAPRPTTAVDRPPIGHETGGAA